MVLPKIQRTQTKQGTPIGGEKLDPNAFVNTGLEQVGSVISDIASQFRKVQISNTLSKESTNLKRDLMYFNNSLEGVNDPEKHYEMLAAKKLELETKYRDKINDSVIFDQFRGVLDSGFLNAEIATANINRIKHIEGFYADVDEKRESLEILASGMGSAEEVQLEAINDLNEMIDMASGQGKEVPGEKKLASFMNIDDAEAMRTKGVNQIYNAYCDTAVEKNASQLLSELEDDKKDNFPGMTQEARSHWTKMAGQQVDTDVINLEIGRLREKHTIDGETNFWAMKDEVFDSTAENMTYQRKQQAAGIINTEHQLYEQNKKHETELLQIEGMEAISKAYSEGTKTITELTQDIDNNENLTETQKESRRKAIGLAQWVTNDAIYGDIATRINKGTLSGDTAIAEIENSRGFGLSNVDANKLVSSVGKSDGMSPTDTKFYNLSLDRFDEVLGEKGLSSNPNAYNHKTTFEIALMQWNDEGLHGTELYDKANAWLETTFDPGIWSFETTPFKEAVSEREKGKPVKLEDEKYFPKEAKKAEVKKEETGDIDTYITRNYPNYRPEAIKHVISTLQRDGKKVNKNTIKVMLDQLIDQDIKILIGQN